MEPVFINYNNLSFNQNKRFTLEFSDGDLLEGFFFLKKGKARIVIKLACHVMLI